MIKNVGELKALLQNINDDATIVLQIGAKDKTYLAMDDDIEFEYDELSNFITLWGSFSDVVEENITL